MKTFKEHFEESVNQTMTLWHGGNLNSEFTDSLAHKKGKWEYGPGLYLTTHYNTARKYSKGGRKLYQITIERGLDLDDALIDTQKLYDFVTYHTIGNKKNIIKTSIAKYDDNGKTRASIFLNSIINNNAIKAAETNTLRKFLVDSGIDYSLVSSPFGWHEMMVVLFNMDKIIDKQIITPNTKIDVFDLPTEFR